MFFAAGDVKLLLSVAYVVVTLSDRFPLFPWLKVWNYPQQPMKKGSNVPGERTMLERADLFHRECAVPDGFADASEFLTEVLNVLEQHASFSVERL